MTVTASGSREYGIPTTYRNTRFRSRLEAHWAVFFDLIDWSWVYEPFDTDGWIPDFVVPGARGVNGSIPLLIEVGPCVNGPDFVEKATKAVAAFPPIISPDPTGVCEHSPFGFRPEYVTLVVGVHPLTLDRRRAGYLTDDGCGFGAGWAHWSQCRVCGEIGVYGGGGRGAAGYGVDKHLPCGHWDEPTDPDRRLFDLWAEAGNRVQWRGAR